jgi:hypothetical protein
LVDYIVLIVSQLKTAIARNEAVYTVANPQAGVSSLSVRRTPGLIAFYFHILLYIVNVIIKPAT